MLAAFFIDMNYRERMVDEMYNFNERSLRAKKSLTPDEAEWLGEVNLSHNLALCYAWPETVYVEDPPRASLVKEREEISRKIDALGGPSLDDAVSDLLGRKDGIDDQIELLPSPWQEVEKQQPLLFDADAHEVLRQCKFSLDEDTRLVSRSRKHGRRFYPRMLAEHMLGRPLEDHDQVYRRSGTSPWDFRWECFGIKDGRIRVAPPIKRKWMELPGIWNGLIRWKGVLAYTWKPSAKYQMKNPNTGKRYSYSESWGHFDSGFSVLIDNTGWIPSLKEYLDQAHEELTRTKRELIFAGTTFVSASYRQADEAFDLGACCSWGKMWQIGRQQLAVKAAKESRPAEIPAEIEEMLVNNERWMAEHPDALQHGKVGYAVSHRADIEKDLGTPEDMPEVPQELLGWVPRYGRK